MTTPALAPRRAADHRFLVIGGLVLLIVAGFSLFVGVSSVSPRDLLAGDPQKMTVFVESRLPRLAALLLAGSAMAVAGLIMQGLTQNRFVSPSTAGTIESATLGILVATMLFGAAPVIA